MCGLCFCCYGNWLFAEVICCEDDVITLGSDVMLEALILRLHFDELCRSGMSVEAGLDIDTHYVHVTVCHCVV